MGTKPENMVIHLPLCSLCGVITQAVSMWPGKKHMAEMEHGKEVNPEMASIEWREYTVMVLSAAKLRGQ